MTLYDWIKLGHWLPGILLPAGVAVHGLLLWRLQRKGDRAGIQRRLWRTCYLSLPLMGLVFASLPISGWWLTHLGRWPLGQIWILLSSLLLLPLGVLTLLLHGRLRAWLRMETPSVAMLRWSAAYALLIFLLLLVIVALMGVRPLQIGDVHMSLSGMLV